MIYQDIPLVICETIQALSDGVALLMAPWRNAASQASERRMLFQSISQILGISAAWTSRSLNWITSWQSELMAKLATVSGMENAFPLECEDRRCLSKFVFEHR